MHSRRRPILPARSRRGRTALHAIVAIGALIGSLIAAAPANALTDASASTSSTAASSVSAAPAAVDSAVDSGLVKTAAVVGFNPENIISDALFYDGNAMSAAEIQSFLDSKIGRCENGKCLNVLSASISSRDAWYSQATGDLVCSALQGGTMRVSELIYRVQVACGISAKAILVTLQKEQGLTTSSAPSDWNLRAAMGASCPDTAPCDPAYSGVGPQIVQGVRQLKIYKAGRFGKQPGVNYIGYSPDDSCGGTNLNIRNYATAALYNYTPYQPNAASLAAGWGIGDGCSSYGNRNFYNYYTSWFGSTGVSDPCAAPTPIAGSGLFVTNADGVNARLAPTTACDADSRSLAGGTLVARVGTYQSWSLVRIGTDLRWIRDDLLTALASTPIPVLVLDDARHLFALAADGSILAYPFSDVGRWGDAVVVAKDARLTQLIEVGDFDGDGHRDLIGLRADKSVWLYRGDGSALGAPTQIDVDWTDQRVLAAAGDVDADGFADVVTIGNDRTLRMWKSDGAGGFRAPQAVGSNWGGVQRIVGGADLDGNGTPDLLAVINDGTMWAYYTDSAGSIVRYQQIGSGWGNMNLLVSPGDFSGDGRADLVARDAAGGLHLYVGTGGALAYLGQIGVGWSGMRSITGAGGVRHSPENDRRPVSPGAGDLDGDGHSDVVALTPADLRLYSGNGAGGWKSVSTLGTGWASSDRIVPMADFNGDGRRDLGRISAAGGFFLLPGAAGGGLGAEVQIGAGWGGLSQVFGGIDFDEDGAADVIGRSADGQLLLYRGDGRGGWASSGSVIGTGWNMFDRVFAVGDFDGDGHSDVVARTPAGALWLYPTSGSGSWLTPRQIGNGWGMFTALIGPGDFDGNSGTDVLARTSAGDLWLYRGNGAGGWAGWNQIGVGWTGITQFE